MPARPALSAAVLGLCLALPTAAQTSLGIASGELGFGVITAGEDSRAAASGSVDVRIAAHHGLQIDLAFEDTAAGGLGHLAAHLYLAPGEGRKYGLFASASDLDGQSFTTGTAGVEGLVALGPRMAVEAHAGIGIAHRLTAPLRMDFVFAGAGLHHAATDSLDLGLSATIAEFDEAGFRALGSTLAATAEWRPRRGAVAVTAALGLSSLEGRDGRPAEGFVALGLSYSFGGHPTDPSARRFRRPDPYAPLALRGMF